MMRITETNIEGLLLIEGLKFPDDRGLLLKPFSQNFFENIQYPINQEIKEVWFTKSMKNVIRAMHIQIGEKACEKIVSVINSSAIDITLDLRIQSKTSGRWFEMELSDKKSQTMYISIGCAHGYKVLEDNTIIMYLATETHDLPNDTGIHWNSFGYYWKIENPLLSEKDLNLKSMNEFKLTN